MVESRTIRSVITRLEAIAPLELAEPWDNVGLLLGDARRDLNGPVFLTIDLTEASLAEAVAAGAGMIVAYHPPIFRELKRITTDDPRGRTLLGAVESAIPVYSPHTALDATEGGVTDWLCDMLAPTGGDTNLGDRRALTPASIPDPDATHKLVTFVPAEHAERVRDGLASIGAGRIGAYSNCSFTAAGTGSFIGGEGTAPVVGQAGTLEMVPETRLEMVCPGSALPLAVEILRALHPYEEPPFDVYPLVPKPRRALGAGRRIRLDQPATPTQLADNLKANLGVDAVKLASAGAEEPVTIVGVCPGSGGSLMAGAIADGCRLFVTGEVSHHEALAATARGCSVLLAGHTNTEGGYLHRYSDRIKAQLPGLDVIVSAVDNPIFATL